MKFENSDWRFNSPAPMTEGAVYSFLDLARKVAAQGPVQDLLEDFKTRFSNGAAARSSTAKWADYDLRNLMFQAADNAALFIEAFINACQDIKEQGYDTPSVDTINMILTGASTWLQIDEHGSLVKRWWIPREGAPEEGHEEGEVQPPFDLAPGPVVPTPEAQPAAAAPVAVAPAPVAQPTPTKVFLCHANEDKAAVRAYYVKLAADGFLPWLDEQDLIPGHDWQQVIPKAVKASDFVVVFLSKTAITKTGFVQKEIRIALDAAQERPDGHIYIIPARLEDCKVPDRLANLHWTDLFADDGYDKLLTALRTEPPAA